MYDELTYSENVEHTPSGTKTTFRVSFSLDGLAAAGVVNDFIKSMTANKGYMWSQIDANIRFT